MLKKDCLDESPSVMQIQALWSPLSWEKADKKFWCQISQKEVVNRNFYSGTHFLRLEVGEYCQIDNFCLHQDQSTEKLDWDLFGMKFQIENV